MNIGQAIATAVVRRYPEPWRDRYETEVIDLIDTAPVSFHEIGELVRGFVVEWSRAFIDTEDPKRTSFRINATRVGFNVAFAGSATVAALACWKWGLIPDAAEAWALIGVMGFWMGLLLARITRRVRRGIRVGAPFSAATGLALVPPQWIVSVLWAALMVGAESRRHRTPELHWLVLLSYTFLNASFAGWLMTSVWPPQNLLDALAEWEYAEQQCVTAQKWVEGCRTMNANGVPSILWDAQASLTEWTRKRDDARNALQALGYRQRFRG